MPSPRDIIATSIKVFRYQWFASGFSDYPAEKVADTALDAIENSEEWQVVRRVSTTTIATAIAESDAKYYGSPTAWDHAARAVENLLTKETT